MKNRLITRRDVPPHVPIARPWRTLVTSWAIFMAAALLLETETLSGKESDNVLRVVRDFYAWYLPAAPGANARGLDLVLKTRASLFTDNLFRALKQDFDASAKNPDEVVGLDFDPFLAAQDPCERYEVGAATRKGKGYSIEIHGVCAGKKRGKPDVIAELVPKGDSWVFANFRYPVERSDLLKVLKSLREQRKKKS